jgi:hypothetical protein
VTLAAKEPAIRTPTAGAHKPVWMKMALKPEQAQAIIKEVGNRKVNHGKLTHMHGFRGKYTILAHLLDMSPYF